MFHEPDAPILAVKFWTPEQVEEAQLLGKQIAKAVQENKQKASTKLPNRAVEHFEGKTPSRYEILRFMLGEIHQGKAYHPGEFKLKSFVEEIQIRMLPAEGLDNYAHFLENNLWR